mmetsp:Transcript_7870/g.17011  ORF Transcript_7870/g.17011 Transcript_7870/m.17011 type:complete len:489 (+) Transcript_7870:86-1552(+)
MLLLLRVLLPLGNLGELRLAHAEDLFEFRILKVLLALRRLQAFGVPNFGILEICERHCASEGASGCCGSSRCSWCGGRSCGCCRGRGSNGCLSSLWCWRLAWPTFEDLLPDGIVDRGALLEQVDGCSGGLAIGLQEVHGGGHGVTAFARGCVFTHPEEDFRARVEHHHIRGVQHRLAQIAPCHLRGLQIAGRVAQDVEDTLADSRLRNVVGTFGCILDRPLSTEELPKPLINVMRYCSLAIALGLDVFSCCVGTGLLHCLRIAAAPDIDGGASVEDEAIPLIQGVTSDGHLFRPQAADGCLANLYQPGLVGRLADVAESGIYSALFVEKALEEFLELSRLVALDFSVLSWLTVEQVIELHCLVGRGAHLVSGGFLAEPEVDVVQQLGAVGLLVGLQDDVGVARVENTVVDLGPRHHLELLNAPDDHSHLGAGPLPCRLCLGRALPRRLVSIRADLCAVGVSKRHAVPIPLLPRDLGRHWFTHCSTVQL